MTTAYQVKKRLKMDHLGLYTLHDVSHSMPQQTIKGQGGIPVTEILSTYTSIEPSLKLHVKLEERTFETP